MAAGRLTLNWVRARPVLVPLARPVVSKVGMFRDWPLILIEPFGRLTFPIFAAANDANSAEDMELITMRNSAALSHSGLLDRGK
jgi:hypothetical protein